MKFIAKLITTSLAVVIVSYLLPGVRIDSVGTAVVFSFILAILNVLVKPVFILLTLPFTILTLGLFLLVINAVIILIASNIVHGINIDGFWWAMLFSIILSVVVSILESIQEAAGGKNN